MINYIATYSELEGSVFKCSARTVSEAREKIIASCDKVGGDVVIQWDNGHVERFDGVEWIQAAEEAA